VGGRLQAGNADARVAVRALVAVVRLRRRDGRADVRGGRALLGALLEAQVRRDGDGEQHADDDQHDEKLDQRETALVTSDPLLEAGKHSYSFGEGCDKALYRQAAGARPAPDGVNCSPSMGEELPPPGPSPPPAPPRPRPPAP